MKTSLLKKFLIGVAIAASIPTVSAGGSLVVSLVQGKTPAKAMQILAEQIDSLIERVNILESKQAAQDQTLKVLQAGFQNIDEFRRRYEGAMEVCKASDEAIITKFIGWNWLPDGDSCKNVIIHDEESLYPKKINNFYCNPQKLNELITNYRKNENRDQDLGGCNLVEHDKELYQNVMKLGL